ncbi:hypothetical protein KC722_00885, partial [Candidatus Kaiserbacteria bacterium]|nr:hypothetical protein [Candidatus Kaiserbacteria bacterium]
LAYRTISQFVHRVFSLSCSVVTARLVEPRRLVQRLVWLPDSEKLLEIIEHTEVIRNRAPHPQMQETGNVYAFVRAFVGHFRPTSLRNFPKDSSRWELKYFRHPICDHSFLVPHLWSPHCN